MYQHCHSRICPRHQGWYGAAACLAHLGQVCQKLLSASMHVHSEGLPDDIQSGAVHFLSGCGHSLESGLKSVHRAKGKRALLLLLLREVVRRVRFCTDTWVADFYNCHEA